jgi:tetratricopeptide (TPR) repeat protein
VLADLLDPFAWGDVRHTLLGAVITDAARTSRDGDRRGLVLLEQLLEEPLLAPALDDALIAHLLDRVKALAIGAEPPVAAALAGVALPLAERAGSALTAELRLEFARAALRAGQLPVAETAASAALRSPGDDPPASRLVQACDLLARAIYDQGRYAEALPVFLAGADHARAASDRRMEWDLVTNAAACQYLLGDPLAALTLVTDRAEPLARELGDPGCLTKSLGDLGNARIALGQLEPARIAFVAALEAARAAGDEQAQSDWLGNLGSIAFREGDAAAGAALHRQALDHSRRAGSPRSAIVDLSHLSMACAAQEHWEEALASLEEAMHLAEELDDPTEIDGVQKRLRDLHAHLGHWRQAVALDLLVNVQPESTAAPPGLASAPPVRLPVPTTIDLTDDDKAFIAQVEELVGVHELDQARAVVNAYVNSHLGSFIGYFELGLVLNEAGDYQASIDAYERALALNPRWPSIHHNALNSWRAIGDLETPQRRYERAIADDPFDPVPRMALGRLYAMLGRHDDAAHELRQAALLDPDSWMVQQELCEALSTAARGRLEEDWDAAWAVFEEAFNEFHRLIEMDPDRRVWALTLLGEHCYNMAYESGLANPSLIRGMLADRESRLLGHAVAAFAEACMMAPERRRPAAGLERALDLIMQIGSAGTWLEYALGLAEAGARDLAIGALEHATSLDGKLAEAHYQLGVLLTRTASSGDTGRLGQAGQELDQAVQLEPGNQRYAGAQRQLSAELQARREGLAP